MGDKENMITISMLGKTQAFLGNLTRAEELFTAGLGIARANRDARSEADFNLLFSATASYNGSPGGSAAGMAETARRYFESQKDNAGVTSAMLWHGWAAYTSDNYLSAKLQWEACRDRALHSHDKGNRNTYSYILEHLSLIAQREGKLSYGHEMLDESYTLYLELADHVAALQVLGKKAVLIADEGDFDASRKLMANVCQELETTSGVDGAQETLRPSSLYIWAPSRSSCVI